MYGLFSGELTKMYHLKKISLIIILKFGFQEKLDSQILSFENNEKCVSSSVMTRERLPEKMLGTILISSSTSKITKIKKNM